MYDKHITLKKHWLSIVASILGSLIFLWLTLRNVNWETAQTALEDSQWQVVFIVIGILSIGIATRALRWQGLLGNRLPLKSTFYILSIGAMMNSVLPLRLGDLTRIYLVRRDGTDISGMATLSTLVTERLLDMLIVILMLPLVLLSMDVDNTIMIGGITIGGVALCGFVALLVLAHQPQLAQRLIHIFVRFAPFLKRFRLNSIADRVLDGLQPLTTIQGIISALFWTIISWLVTAIGLWMLINAVPDLPQTAASRSAATLSIVTVSVSAIVPFTVANVGPFHAATIFALLTSDISLETATVFAILSHLCSVISNLIWGIIGLLTTRLPFTEVLYIDTDSNIEAQKT